ncbi:hypothetical protein HZR84_06375 [Hyphobacterium sp. CCMP332]|nr:hypothetical protein HZR84_06375 [Hyphobacterium sp. CCMP332]
MWKYLTLLFFISSLSATSHSRSFDTLTLRINFIIIQKNDGGDNFQLGDSLHMAYLKNSVERLNQLYSFKKSVYDDSTCNVRHTYKDSGIRFRLSQIIEIKNDSLWDNDQDKNWSRCPNRKKWYLLDLQDSLDWIIPKSEQGINLYLTVSKSDFNKNDFEGESIEENFSQVACSMFPSSDSSDFSVVHFPNAYLKYLFMKQHPYEWGINTFGGGLAHELGHSLGLVHDKTCNNIMNGAGTVKRKNLNDIQVEKARNNILHKNLKKYIEK